MADTTRNAGAPPPNEISSEEVAVAETEPFPPPPPYAPFDEPMRASAEAVSVEVSAEEPPTRSWPWRITLLGIATGFLGALLAIGLVALLDDDPPAAAAPQTIVERVETQILQPDNTTSRASAVARQVLPSIVTVEVSDSSASEFDVDGSGSGVVFDTSGLLFTNQHVIEGAERVQVIFANGTTYDAEIVGEDSLTDLAVLRISAAGLTAVEIGASEELSIGDTAIAIGSPLGLQGGPSVTVGVLSAFDRRVRTAPDSELYGMLQTDAPITRGSSGGALVDASGRLIGITTAIGVSDVGAEGLGFAIPIEMVLRIANDLVADGQVSHAFLGITGSTFFDEVADGARAPSGVVIESVINDSAANAAGLVPGDVITSFDGAPVTTMERLVSGLRLYRVGDSVLFTLNRSGGDVEIPIILMERPEGV